MVIIMKKRKIIVAIVQVLLYAFGLGLLFYMEPPWTWIEVYGHGDVLRGLNGLLGVNPLSLIILTVGSLLMLLFSRDKGGKIKKGLLLGISFLKNIIPFAGQFLLNGLYNTHPAYPVRRFLIFGFIIMIAVNFLVEMICILTAPCETQEQ